MLGRPSTRRCATCGSVAPAGRPFCISCGNRFAHRRLFDWMIAPFQAMVPQPATVGPADHLIHMATDQNTAASARALRVQRAAAAQAATSVPTDKPWYTRPLLMVPICILAALLVIAGIYAYKLHNAFTTINSVSTPAPSISGAALGGSDDVVIDTSAAQTAVAGGSVSANSSASSSSTNAEGGQGSDQPSGNAAIAAPSSTPVVDATSAAEPTPAVNLTMVPDESPEPESTPQPTATSSPTAEPTATKEPEVILSEIERIDNGDFELGGQGWYVEQGAQIVKGGGRSGPNALVIDQTGGYADQRVFFVPGTKYQLTAWGKLSERNGEIAEIGVAFWDADGNRMTDSEPTPRKIRRDTWTEISFHFKVPEEATSVSITFWKASGLTQFTVDDVSLRSIVPPDSATVEYQEPDSASMSILVMGVDARDGEAIDTGVRPDSLMVLHLNAKTGTCRILSIPRDTRVDLPGYGMSKVNHALAVGGIDYQIDVIEQVLKLPIKHYVLIDFNGFEDLVDAVGGISVDVPYAFTATDGTAFAPGVQTMDGRKALSYARFRGGDDGDFGRIERQQQILRALVSTASSLNIVTSINELLPAVESNLRTDLSPSEITGIGLDYKSRCTDSNINMLRLQGSQGTFQDPLIKMPLSYVIVDEAEIRRQVASLLEA